ASEKPAGLLPIPDYTGSFWARGYLTGDWGGVRTDLANKGIQFGGEWNQYVQGVANGGHDRATEHGGFADYTVNLDLMRMPRDAGRASREMGATPPETATTLRIARQPQSKGS